jgi:hypothetical protein
MSTETKINELETLILNAYKRPLDMQKAGDAQDRVREELRKEIGEVNVSVDLIREVRA